MIALFAAVQAYAATPQAAAIGALWFARGKPPVVRRINVSGRYATVLTEGGRLEGVPETVPILVEHFSFGWQPLDSLDFQCRLDSHGFGESVDTALMRGMPQPENDRPCSGYLSDAGPSDDLEQVRAMMRGPLVPSVVVSGVWAIGQWYGGGGGQSLYHKHAGHWELVRSDGGAMGVPQMRAFGVPESAWCAFRVYDAKCP